jgi:hypothetical protein
LQPAYVTTPATAALGFAVQVRVAPAGVVMLRVTEAVLPVTALPPASCTATTGWVKNAMPALENEGLVVKTSLLAAPTVMMRSALTSLASVPEVAVSEYVPALSILQPAKVAAPATAALGFAVHVRVAPAGVVMLRVTGAVLEVTVLPPASVTATTGWEPKATPPVELEGSVVKDRLVAEPVVMVKVALTSLVRVPEVAVSVYVPAPSTAQPAKVATPATAALGFAAHVRVAPAAVVRLRVTGALLRSTLWPWASRTSTTG